MKQWLGPTDKLVSILQVVDSTHSKLLRYSMLIFFIQNMSSVFWYLIYVMVEYSIQYIIQ